MPTPRPLLRLAATCLIAVLLPGCSLQAETRATATSDADSPSVTPQERGQRDAVEAYYASNDR